MSRLARYLLVAIASGALLTGSPSGAAPGLAQPQTPCDQLTARLADIRAQQAQVRADYAAALEADDPAALSPVVDQLDSVLTETEQLLQRMDDCSRSPVPSQAD